MKFATVNIIFVAALALLMGIHFFAHSVSWWMFAVLGLCYTAIVFTGCINLSLNFFTKSLCRGVTGEKVVAISFDDGPHPTHTSRVLDTLKQFDVEAAFFCIGKNVAGNESTLKQMANDRHLIGNHSYSHHYWFDMFGPRKMLADLEQADNAVTSATGLRPSLFRPPYGVMNPNLAKAIKKGGYTSVGWSIRSFDTGSGDGDKLLSRILAQLSSGDIILLHDTMEITVKILPALITEIQNKGFKILRLDKMLNIRAYA